MRSAIVRMFCVTLFFLLPHLYLQGCSSDQQADADLGSEQYSEEGYDEIGNEAGESEYGNYAEEGYESDDEYGYESEEGNYGNYGDYAEEEGGYDNYGEDLQAEGDTLAAEGEELTDEILEGGQTTGDLENIIAGQDANQVEPIEEEPAVVDPELAGAQAGVGDYVEQAPVNQAGTAMPAQAMQGGLPEMNSKMPYVVRVGESLSSIAQKIYGSSDKAMEMAELTSLSNPNFIKPGDVVYYRLTEQTLAFATAYENAPRVELTVQRGDTLAGIAQRAYGNQGDWKVIWRQNAIDNPDRLEVGQTLVYLAPEALSAALDFTRSMKLAELIKVNYGQQDINPESSNSSDLIANPNTNTQQMSGLEIAKSMFSTFSVNVGMTG